MKNNSLFMMLLKMRVPFLVIIITYTIAIVGLLLIDGVDNKGNPYSMSIFDAFYFISYTATTIGFGETPYDFTYAQRIWVNFCIYLTVIGWLYGIGSLISLLQDKLFIEELEKAKFLRKVKNLNGSFIIILGYNDITKRVIKKAMENDVRAVVIEKDEAKINSLILENFTPTVPVLSAKKYTLNVLQAAGIEKANCRAIVSLLEDDASNLRITLISKLLNKYVKVAVKSTSSNNTENLKDLDAKIVVNPFSIISSEINMALVAPNIFKLEKWLYKVDTLTAISPSFPKGTYVICGYGRMGKAIYEKLNANNIDARLIEIDTNKKTILSKNEISNIVFADADNKELLTEVGIKKASAIIAATNNDTTNLSILATAKKLNPDIVTITRQNELEDDTIFKESKINHIFIPSKILVNKITNALVSPLCDRFIKLAIKKDDVWAGDLISKLIKQIGENPILTEFKINERFAPMLQNYLNENKSLKLSILGVSLHNANQRNNIMPLLLQREDDIILLPSWEDDIKIGDKLLFACDENAKNDMEYICQNSYEFYYALNGKEKLTIFKGIK
ncbi:MAG: potassium channel family protein [Campylobacterota bacterium]